MLGVAVAGLLAGNPAGAQTKLAPLSDSDAEILSALPDEKPYNVRIHFLRSNERRHDVFFPSLRHLGGGYIGVGADQNYTLAAVARSEIMWLIDIDGDVVQWHRIYSALIPAAETPAELLALLSGNKDAQVKAALAARWPEEEAKRLWPTFLRYRGLLTAHLRAEKEVRQRGRPVTWIADPELYQHIRALMQARRVIARVGDLHGETTLVAIGAAARRTGHLIRTIYLSNVEQWFRYSPQFRRNLAAMPRDDKTLVLRTLARGELTAPDLDRWHFSVQTLDDFLYRMDAAQPPAQGVLDLMPEMAKSHRPGTRGLSWLGEVKAQPRPRPEWALLPPLRDDEVPPPPPPRLVPWARLPPLRSGPFAPGPVVVVRPAVVPWSALPPLRPGPAPETALPPLVARALVPWTRLPPLRAVVNLKAVSWQALPPLRGVEVAAAAAAAADFRVLPPLRPGLAPPRPAGGSPLSWESLPPLRDAAVLPLRRVPWRRLPPLRAGLAAAPAPTG